MTNKEKKYRESYISTLEKLFLYAEQHYAPNKMSELLGGDQNYTYQEFCAKTREISNRLSAHGIGADDKVIILAQNMPNWTVAFFACVAFGRVVVPILADSSAVEVENIAKHSEAKAVFVSDMHASKISAELAASMNVVYNLDRLELVSCKEGLAEAATVSPQPDSLAGLFYTSGTTGRSKGVMLSHRNLCQNIFAAEATFQIDSKGRWLSILPMAHTYEMAFSLLYPFYLGASVSYIKGVPTPSILMKAMAQVHPHVVNSVPLIIEKVYKSKVTKTISESKMLSWMDRHCQGLLYRIIGKKLIDAFGGSLIFFGIGGAKLDPVVDDFLIRARFPHAIGYGLTETAPLICSAQVGKCRTGSIGWHSKNVEVRLADVDPTTGEGEIQCKGPNVMLGYYKDPERTASVFTEDGWFKTGDLASVDKDGYYYIKGRIGTMIVGPSGENIYPEEIESIINNYDEVDESLVVNRDGRLVALVHLRDGVLEWTQERVKEFMDYVNNNTRKSNNIQGVEIVKDGFVKTATQKIRRFLYNQKNNQ